MPITTGTSKTQTEHSQTRAVISVTMAMGIPAALAIGGLLAMGWGVISWAGAIIWGAVAALAMAIFMAMGRSMGMTTMNLADLLGSTVAEPNTTASNTIGMGIHLMNGALLAIAWTYTMAIFAWPATWLSGLLWGAFVSLLALLMFSSLGAIHPKIRAGKQDDPGPAGTNFGKQTPVGIVMAHLVYGLVLGVLYQWIPLA